MPALAHHAGLQHRGRLGIGRIRHAHASFEESRRTNQQHRHHDQKHHGVRRLRIEDLGQPFDQAHGRACDDGAEDRAMPPITTTANTTINRFEPMPGVTA